MKYARVNNSVIRHVSAFVLLFMVFQINTSVAQNNSEIEYSNASTVGKSFKSECELMEFNIETLFELLSSKFETGTAFAGAFVQFKLPELIETYNRLCKR